MGTGDKALKSVLWENVRAGMVSKYGSENLQRLARESKIGPASASRIKEQKTSIGLDVIEKVAKHLGFEPWQLIARGMSDDKFLQILIVWNETDERGRRMLLNAAEGARLRDGAARPERTDTGKGQR